MDKSKFQDQRGSAILMAMIASIVVALVVGLIMQQSQVTENSTRSPRVKSAMATIESQVLAAAYDGSLFTACSSEDPGASEPGCRKINPAEVAKLTMRIPGARCSDSAAFCGVEVRDQVFNSATKTLTAKIVYTGEEIAVAPIQISSVINSEAWMSSTSQCDPATPLLMGFDSSGAAICKALPGDCPPGYYVSNFDPMSVTGTSAVLCSALSGTPSCPAGSFISLFQWYGGSSFNVACQPIYNPFVPSPAALGDATLYSYEVASLSSQAPWPAAPTPPPPPPPPPPGSCVWSCSASNGNCTPGPAPGCSYGNYLAASATPDRRGQACPNGAATLQFQRTGPSITCDIGWLGCDCPSAPPPSACVDGNPVFDMNEDFRGKRGPRGVVRDTLHMDVVWPTGSYGTGSTPIPAQDLTLNWSIAYNGETRTGSLSCTDPSPGNDGSSCGVNQSGIIVGGGTFTINGQANASRENSTTIGVEYQAEIQHSSAATGCPAPGVR